jgi:carbon monoxide dehydrogenase subunit G
MIRAEYSHTLSVPRTVLFDYLSNPTNDLHWQASCVEARLLDGSAEVGSHYAIVFSFLGRRMNFECQITCVEAPARYGFRVLQGSFLYEGSYSLEEVDGGTRLSWQFDVEPGKFFGILPVSLLRKVLVSQVEKDFSRLEVLLQEAAAIKSKELIHV